MDGLPLQADWLRALRHEDGYKLMVLLRKEPRLLTVKDRGCNVLHLAVRCDWFGLVEEILRKFDHLHQGASSIHKPSSSRLETIDPEHDTEDLTAYSQADATGDFRRENSPALDLASFRDLLTAKEGDGDGSSEFSANGLDVFALAVMQGHGAIKAVLADAVSKVDYLFDDHHPYKDIFRRMNGQPVTVPISSASSTHTKEREILREIMLECFAKKSTKNDTNVRDVATASDQPDIAPNVSVKEKTITPESHATNVSCSVEQMQRLEDRTDVRLIQRWKLTSPFLPLEEFLFLACQAQVHWLRLSHKEDWELVFKRCAERQGEIEFMKYLFAIHDTRRTALHHGVCHSISLPRSRRPTVNQSFKLIPDGEEFRDCINARDALGRTLFHTAIALGRTEEFLLKDERTDVNAICGFEVHDSDDDVQMWESSMNIISAENGFWPHANNYRANQTALHLVIRSPHLTKEGRRRTMKLLLDQKGPHVNVNSVSKLSTELPEFKYRRVETMTPLQLAAYLGDAPILELLASDDTVYDSARLNNLSLRPEDDRYEVYSALHLAARAGHPHAIRIILATGKFDPIVQDPDGNTALHLATRSIFPFHFPHALTDFFEIPFKNKEISFMSKESLSVEERRDLIRLGESKRQGCINLLLLAGIDIWQTNRDNEIADIGPEASPEYSAWWYEKLAKETQEAKGSWNAAASAISVTAALVATASYVGPLQPPLGYAAQADGLIDKVQVGILSVRIFIVTNTLAFYVALAAIMLSLTPSLPMPQQSILDELKLIRRSVTWAMCFLLLSIVAVLSAFASASIAVIPDEGTWNHGGLTISTLSLGTIIGVVVLLLCGFRLLRLFFHKNNTLRRFYESYIPL